MRKVSYIVLNLHPNGMTLKNIFSIIKYRIYFYEIMCWVSEGLSSSFTGCIEILCFRNAYCEESTLDELINAINIISTKSYVDEFQRINKKEVTKGSKYYF